MRALRVAIATIAVASLAVVAAPAVSASAAQSTTTRFVGDSSISIDFGGDWLFSVSVSTQYPSLMPAGTVSLFADGVSSPIATDAAVQAGGVAYLAAPAADDPLAPGTYDLTAIYTPAAGTYLESSKTRTHATLTIASVAVAETATLETTVAGTPPTVHTTLGGDWVDRHGPPAGEWAVAVLDPGRSKVFAGSAVQPAGAGAATTVEIPIDFATSTDTTYEVIVAFYPSEKSASGVRSTQPITMHFTTAAPTFADIATAPIPAPAWVLWAGTITLALVLLLLALVIVLVARDRRSRYIEPERAPVTRATSRILLYDAGGSVLLFLTKAPDTSGVARWITPGGGVDPGEDHDDAAVRELYEETGLDDVELTGPVFAQDFDVEWDDADHDRGHVEFYVGQVPRFEPSSEHWTDDEKVDVLAHRWFTAEELERSEELFEPLALPDLIRRFLPDDGEAPRDGDGGPLEDATMDS